MEFLKDLIKVLFEGVVEWWTECKISSKRQEYFTNKKSKLAKVCHYVTVAIAIVLMGIGIIKIVRGEILQGIICICLSGGMGMWLLVERGTARQ